jgi:hypothetical protein
MSNDKQRSRLIGSLSAHGSMEDEVIDVGTTPKAGGSSRMSPIINSTPESSEHKRWDCVHLCPRCGHITKLSELDLKAATSGIAACPTCTWTGQIEIQIVERPQSVPKISANEEPRGVDCAVELEVFTVEGIVTNNGKA